MIQSIKLVNFRSFVDKYIENFEEKNFIVGPNGKGKTNILEAISLLGNNSIIWLSFDFLVRNGEDFFFIEVVDSNIWTLSLYYSKETKKKEYKINGKKNSKKKFIQTSYSCVIFSPIVMNMMYLSPSLRRNFLDTAVKSSFPEYEAITKEYKKILKNRNLVLKAIAEKKAQKSEIEYFDTKFIEIAESMYQYRYKYLHFLEKKIESTKEYFSKTIDSLSFFYQTKVDPENIWASIKSYLEKNKKRDIILGKTHIWPHIDDFVIQADKEDISYFASRGEMKSVIIYLKLLEGIFIEKHIGKKPILIIDDLLSELDWIHKDNLLSKISYYQTFISNIEPEIHTHYITI